MFDRKKNNSKDFFGKPNRIVEKTRIKGDIHSVSDFRIDGEVIGNFSSEGKLVIGETGRIIGNITCKNLDIEGYYEGKAIVAELLSLKSKAKIIGEIIVGKIAVEPGAEFMATCQMKGMVKNIESSGNVKPKSEEKAV
ncbi:MAG: polymer-forming cytoskeletal protein [Flavobacteriaceae bacterium]